MSAMPGRRATLPIVVLALLGVVVAFVGPEPRLAFGGAMLVFMAVALFVSLRMLRPGPDGAGPSPGEQDAWSTFGLCLAALLVLGMIAAGGFDPGWAAYLMLFAYGLVVVAMPVLRRRRMAQYRRHRGAVEDERDGAIQLLAAKWSKHALEALLVVAAALYAVVVGDAGPPGGALALVAALFACMFVANAVGELVAACAYWRDRR